MGQRARSQESESKMQQTAVSSQYAEIILCRGYLFPASCQLPACPELVAGLLAESPVSQVSQSRRFAPSARALLAQSSP